MRFLAIDQGTTSTRALLVDAAGAVEEVAAVSHRQIYPRPGWVEHDPAEILGAIETCLEAAAGRGPIAAIGLANQGESCLAWDALTGEPASPVIVWQDARTAAACDALKAQGAEALTLGRAGLPLDPYFSASKLGWLWREEGAVRALARAGRLRLGTTDAWFRQRLTGVCATDATTASRTSLMSLGTLGWDEGLCALFGVPAEVLPPIGPTTGALGLVRVGGREVVLGASVVDQQGALYGHGARAPGDAKITFGTGAFALVLTGGRVAAPAGPLPTVAWAPDGGAPVFALDGGVYAASSAVNWARDLGLFSDFGAIARFDRPPAIGRGLAFVPALAGLACPHWDRRARGAWLGLGLDHDRADLMQALLEGVALRTAEALGAIAQAVPLADTLTIDGGMSANGHFCRFLADALGRRIIVSAEPELTALGTAALAAAGVGQAVDCTPRGPAIEPDARAPRADWAARFAAARAAVQGYGAAAG